MRPNIIAAALAILAVSGCSTTHESTGPTLTTTVYVTPTQVATPTPTPAPPVAKGDRAYDGPLAFQVLSSDVSDWAIDEAAGKLPQGEFIHVILEVSNVVNEPHTFRAEYQRLVDDQGRIYDPAISRISLSDRSLDINPGNITAPNVFFDVPVGTQPSQYMLIVHSSRDSMGAASRIEKVP